MDDTTSPPKFRTKYKYGMKKRTQHLAKILKQRKVEESSDSDSTIITTPNVPSGTSSIATTSRTQTKLRLWIVHCQKFAIQKKILSGV